MNKNDKKRNIFTVTFFTIFQIAFIILMAIFGNYDNAGQKDVPTIYASKLFIFIKISFLFTFKIHC